MASDADEFKEELQRLAHVTKIRNDERIQASERALQLFGPIRNFLLRFNEALGEFGKIEVAGPYPVGKHQHATATITAVCTENLIRIDPATESRNVTRQ